MVIQSPSAFADFGSLLKFLRRRARLTQMELGIAVGYTEAHVSRLENNQRLPDLAALAALFVPALDLNDEPELAARLLELAAMARGEAKAEPTPVTPTSDTVDIVGAIESIPPLPADWVPPHSLALASDQLARERRIVICGLPGVGKTTLAAALAAQGAQAQPVFWLTFTEGVTTSVESVIRQLALFALTLGGEAAAPLLTPRDPHARPLPLDEQLARLSQALAPHDCLLCFDRAQLVIENTAIMQALQHLAATTRAQFLLTSREEIPLPEFVPLRIEGLEQDEAAQLVARLGVALSPERVEQLVRKTAGSPMLLRLASAQLRGTRVEASTFIAHLETAPHVAAYLLETVVRSLSTPARRMAEWLSIFHHPIDLNDEHLIERFHSLVGRSVVRWAEAVAELQRRQLIAQPASATLHPLVRDHIYTTLGNDPARRRMFHRLAADWLAQDPALVLQAAYHYGRAHRLAQAVAVLTDQAEEIINLAQREAGVQIVDELLAQARRHTQHPEWRRALLTLRGDLLAQTTRAPEAEANYRDALALTAERPVRAHIAIRLAQNLILRNRAAEALALHASVTRGLSVRAYPLLHAQWATIESQGRLALSQFDEAARAAERALRLAKQVEWIAPRQVTQIQAQVNLVLGTLHSLRGELPAARACWQTAIVAARAVNLKSLEYRAHTNLGITFYQEGDLARALEHYQAALLGARALADSNLAARVLSNMAILYHLRGELDTALDAAAQARELREQMGDHLGVTNIDNTRASVLLAQHRLDEARAIAEGLVREAANAGNERLLGGYLDTLAQIQLAQGEIGAARILLQRALELPAAQTDAALRSDLQHHLILILLASGEVEAAQRTLASLPEPNAPKVHIERQLVSGWLALARGEAALAQEHAQSAQARIASSGCALYQNAAMRLSMAATQRTVTENVGLF